MGGLDHLVVCVDDLDGAAADWAALGFTVTPRAQHPFGTHNRLIQLDGFFIELLTIAEPEKITPAPPGGFSFAAFNQQFAARGEGASMLVFETDDFEADHAAARENGLQTYPPFTFSRLARNARGEEAKVSFGLNFVTCPALPDMAFFSCQQFNPEYFWDAAYQTHDNGIVGVGEVVIVCEDVAAPVDFFARLIGVEGNKGVFSTARGDIVVCDRGAFCERFGRPPRQFSGPATIAGLTLLPKGVKQPGDKVQESNGLVVKL